ncbi:uncharacterized protein LOC126803416 [Argentina anserina]|uniref:uncharacterized protein LOC126803416 n=1 Tax=Argentina anserina TaxID=57926 RepID=UPI0021765E34|nr:uncharacterized protein LOC126803416 [Potentilla anserina]
MAPKRIRKFKSGAKKRKENKRIVNGPDVEEEEIDENSDHDVEEAEIDEDSDHDVEGANIEEDNIDHDVEKSDFEEDNNDHVVEEVGIEEDNIIDEAPFDMDDPGNWNKIDKNITNFLVERGPKRDNNVVFPKDKTKKHLVGQLAEEGMNDWHNCSDRIKSHEKSRYHIAAMKSWIELAKRLKLKLTIDASLHEQINQEREHWKQVLQRILAIVKRLGKNNLAFCGDSEKLYEDNNDLFLQMIELLVEFDLNIKKHVGRIDKDEVQYHYLSHKIQNEIIQLLVGEVKSSIISRVKEAKYFSVLLDCTPDLSNEEQMSLVLRIVNVSTTPVMVEEYFLGFLKVADTSGLGLLNELLFELKTLGLNVSDIRGQGYDNGSNMKGKNKGVQSRLLAMNPRGFYTPCACHFLNLVLSDMAHCCFTAESFFGVVQQVYCLFSASTKRWQVFKEHVSGFTVKLLSETRWESRVESVKAIRYETPQIRQALTHIVNSKEDYKTKSDADALARFNLQNFEFLLGITIWFRETGFEESLVEAKEIASEMEIEPFKTYEENFGLLFDSDKLRSADRDTLKDFCANLTDILKHGENSDLNEDDLYHDLRMLCQDLSNDPKRAIDVLNYITKSDGYYPHASITYRILLTIPVTVAFAERSFSKLKLIKTYLRFTMSQERLSGLAMISIEKDIVEKLNYADLIKASNFCSP